MDYKYKCKNHDACKNCELRAVETVVFTIRHSEVLNYYFIRSDDSRGIVYNAIRDIDLFSTMKEIKDYGEQVGFKVVFEVD